MFLIVSVGIVVCCTFSLNNFMEKRKWKGFMWLGISYLIAGLMLV